MNTANAIAQPLTDTPVHVTSSAGTERLWLGRFAKLVCVSTFLLILVGSLVTTTGSGLAVPDWPLSFGKFFPKMTGGVFYEHGHRMVAGTVGIFMTILAIWIWIAEDRRWVKWLALGAWVGVVIQAVLGGITVLYKLPTPVSVSHAGTAMAFFSSTVVLAMITSPSWRRESIAPVHSSSPTTVGTVLVWCVVGIVYAQIIMGAVMRHMGAGLAIPDFPLSYGYLIPPINATNVAVHFAHRVGAVIVGLIVIAQWLYIRRLRNDFKVLNALSEALVFAYLIQFALGAFTIWTIKSLPVTTAHVGMGALMLALSVILITRTLRQRWLANRGKVS